MKIAFVLLYVSFGPGSTEQVPFRFSSIAECQATFDAMLLKGSDAPTDIWKKRTAKFPVGSCIPVLIQK